MTAHMSQHPSNIWHCNVVGKRSLLSWNGGNLSGTGMPPAARTDRADLHGFLEGVSSPNFQRVYSTWLKEVAQTLKIPKKKHFWTPLVSK